MTLAELRESLAITQAEAAKRLRVATSAYTQWETGARGIGVATALKIMEAFGVAAHVDLEAGGLTFLTDEQLAAKDEPQDYDQPKYQAQPCEEL